MPEEAIQHPTKTNTKLLEFLIKRFSKLRDTILDPMAGTGSTGVVAALHGRNAINIELEKKFYDWMEKAKENVEKYPSLIQKGRIRNILGDARHLSELLVQQVDVIITSPPYAEVTAFHDPDFMKATAKEQSEKVRRGEIKGHYMTPEARRRVFNKIKKGRIEDERNIGNLPYGKIDIIKNGKDLHDEFPSHGMDIASNKPSINKDVMTEKETYLSAMLRVYSEMRKVLKPDGLAIIIVRPFIRNKEVIDLPYQTWLLLTEAGFELVDLYKLRLKRLSFWRILYEKKHPEMPKLRHEYILVCSNHQENKEVSR